MQVHALAQEKVIAQVEQLADAGAGAAADDGGLDLGHVAFVEIGKAREELLADHKAQNGVAKKLKTLVGGQAGVRARCVRQRGTQKFALAEAIPKGLLAVFQDLLFSIGGQIRRHIPVRLHIERKSFSVRRLILPAPNVNGEPSAISYQSNQSTERAAALFASLADS